VPASPRTQAPPPRIRIQLVRPTIEEGRWPVKRTAGDVVAVSADVFRDGHEVLRAVVRWQGNGESEWHEAPLTPLDAHHNGVRWTGAFRVEHVGLARWTIQAWVDVFAGWRDEVARKLDAGQIDMSGETSEGVVLLKDAAGHASGEDRTALGAAAAALESGEPVAAALDARLAEIVERVAPRSEVTEMPAAYEIYVDRVRARFGSWYELFPRSFGGFRGVEGQLPRLQELGFDVLYLPPIHPIGHTHRKGRNNTLLAGPDDPGSPWAIGDETGGHDAIHPELGTLEDFDSLVAAARAHDIDIALDFAINASGDHPWLKEHPEWFNRRPDGTIKYAENPPKKYQDIYPLNFWCEDREGLWRACRDVLLFWIDHGVRTFRVDNPHTKPFAFWEWVINEVHRAHPDVIFLSEAFTRPKRLKYLAKLGFSQSYTYFTWRNAPSEIRQYLTELTQSPAQEYLRGNLFANTPDILHEFLQRGGRPAFRLRLLLAATLSPVYGIYSGFELCENVPLKQGSEEYLHSEKYEIRVRDWNAPGNINADVARINQIRRTNPALQLYSNLTFHHSENENILFYKKSAPEGRNDLLIAVNVDPFRPHETMVHVPLDALDLHHDRSYVVEDLLTGARYTWRGVRNYVRLDPHEQAGHVLRLER
jgi:starch synthase (maltosyl-transferring)